jgi:hypothetical protein
MKRLALLITTLLFLTVPAVASAAYNPLGGACKVGGDNSPKSSTACTASSSDPISGPNGELAKVSLIIATITGVAAVIVIIVGGIQYVTSAGDSSKAASARNMIIGALVGLVIIAAAQGILMFVLSKL